MYHSDLPRVDSVFFKLGTAVHEALEYAGKIVRNEYGRPFTPDEIEKIRDKYLQLAAKERIEDLTMLKDGQEMVMNRVADFSLGRKVLDLEKRFRTTTPEGVPLIGAMDKIVEIDDETVGVIDYKTNKFASSGADLKKDMQLSLYDLAARVMYPEYRKVVLIMDYLRTRPVYSYRTPEERDAFSKYLKGIYEEILNTKEDDLKPNLNQFCSYCDYKTHCSRYAQVMSQEEAEYRPAEILDINELIEEFDLIKNQKKILESRERELKMIVAERIREIGDDLCGENKKVVVKQSSRLNYDVEKVLDIVPIRDVRKVVAINKSRLDSYLANVRPDLKDKVMATASFTFNSPWFEVQDFDGGEDVTEED